MSRTTHASRRRRGFTLKELIVIVFVLFLMVGMLLPAVRTGRGPSRRTQCINNQHQLSLALIRYEFDHRHYPGWVVNQNPDAQGCGGREASWVFPLLPNLDRTDIYNHYGPQGPKAGAPPSEHLKILVCPDDAESINNRTSMTYVVNTGYYHDAYPYRQRAEHPAVGVFTYQYRTSPADQLTRLSSAEVTDGLAQTLALSENIDAGTWLGRPSSSGAPNRVEEGCVGFAWLGSTPIPRINAAVGTSSSCVSTRVGFPDALPRPASFHAGGVVASFCDGHAQFLSEDLDPAVFALLCTPKRAVVGFEGEPVAPQRELRETEY